MRKSRTQIESILERKCCDGACLCALGRTVPPGELESAPLTRGSVAGCRLILVSFWSCKEVA
jgi:hypothetical protein